MKTAFYTGVGDKGSTKLGKRKVSKDNVLFDALGTLDELNSFIGLVRASIPKTKRFGDVRASLLNVQQNLFIAQAEVAALGIGMKTSKKITAKKTKEIEAEIAKIDREVPTIKNFIIPGATELSGALDTTRAISRRLERTFVAFSKKKKLSKDLLQYLNRLSSLLFALARLVEKRTKAKLEHPTYT